MSTPTSPNDDRAAGPAPPGSLPASGDPSHTGHPQPSPDDPTSPEEGLTVEDLVEQLESVVRERDEFLALAQAKQAEFENFRKRMMKQQADDVARAAGRVVDALLPVLDAFDDGVRHGIDALEPLRAQLLLALEKEGLARLDPGGEPFDPSEHEAVAHEPGDGESDGPVVAEVLRAGYRWQGHLLRPVMVRVRD